MSRPDEVGKIGWIDLTVGDATRVRDFYAGVVGWKPEGVEMGGYQDFNMTQPSTGTPVAGVCHARGVNAGLPAQWLIYVTVADLEASVRRVAELGGALVRPVTDMGGQGRFAIVRDPEGAVCALFERAGS